MSTARRVLLALVTGLSMIAVAPAERAAARQTPIASERPSGPTVDFIAVDADGAPVSDLQAAEVEVRIADRVRAIETFAASSPARLPLLPVCRRRTAPTTTSPPAGCS